MRAILPVMLTLAACAGPLPYRPEHQPFGATISADIRVTEDRLRAAVLRKHHALLCPPADIRVTEDRLRVEIDSEGYRVERAVLVRDGAVEIAPEALVPPSAAPSGGLSIGLGVGTGGSSSGGSYSVGTGVGVGLGGPRPLATTLAVFRLADAGPPPWRLRVKVMGVDAVDIVVDPAARPSRP